MTEVPFGYIEIRDDVEVWCLSWQERVELLEHFVCSSGHRHPEGAHNEFWDYVNHSTARYLMKDFEPLPEAAEEEFNAWVLEEE